MDTGRKTYKKRTSRELSDTFDKKKKDYFASSKKYLCEFCEDSGYFYDLLENNTIIRCLECKFCDVRKINPELKPVEKIT